jgi:radical SAM superfamily enzyme YgiQ (UPF0313 family)/biotin operon repressor
MSRETDDGSKVNLLLISAPWAAPVRPSIQLGVLKAYVDREPALAYVKTRILSAHLGIPVEAAEREFPELWCCAEPCGESFYELLYHKEFGLPGLPRDRQLLNDGVADLSDEHYGAQTIRKNLKLVEAATKRYVRSEIIPHIQKDRLNVVGFTLNFNQVYASLYMSRLILRYAPKSDVVLLLGGHSVSIPRVRQQIKKLGIAAYYILGEGEIKLSKFLSFIRGRKAEPALGHAASEIPGVSHSLGSTAIDHIASKAFQMVDLREVPTPCYDDYFDELRRYSRSPQTFVEWKELAVVMLEGSRGCFAKCDFCGFNANWSGFRKLPARPIVEAAERLATKYRCRSVFYVDNVCDTWAEEFARLMISRRSQLEGFMELRAHHPEQFWTGLKLAGVERIQVGVEALSATLIRKMRKGTTLIQNLRSQKYISELGVKSGANLIMHHPKSTCLEIAETKAILDLIPHFEPFHLTRFAVSIGSPIYEELSDDDKRTVDASLSVRRFRNGLNEHELDWRYALPPMLRLAPNIEAQWDEFERWYCDFRQQNEARNPKMTASRVDHSIHILDMRYDTPAEHILTDSDALVFDHCHAGPSISTLEKQTGLSRGAIDESIQALQRDGLIIETEGHYLSLALRPQRELVANYYELQRARELTELRSVDTRNELGRRPTQAAPQPQPH